MAAPVLVAGFFLFSGYIKKYEAVFAWKKRTDKDNSYVYYKDLNHDGNDDEISFFDNLEGQAAVKITFFEEAVFGQFNMNGKFPFWNTGRFINADNDSLIDISMVYLRNDSAFICVFQPVDTSKLYVDLFIDKVADPNKNLKIGVTEPNTTDLNKDGFNEVCFSLNAGYSLYPRNFYVVDIRNMKVRKSPYLAILTNHDSPYNSVCDIDNEGKPEFLLSSSSPGNIPQNDSVLLHDYSSWIIILNENLDFWMDPIELRGTPTGLIYRIFEDKNEKKIFYHFINRAASGDSSCFLLLDPVTKKIIRRNTKLPVGGLSIVPSATPSNTVTLHDKKGNFYSVNEKLELVKIKNEKDFKPSSFVCMKDFDADGEVEMVYLDDNYDGLFVFRNDYTSPVCIQVPLTSSSSLKNVSFLEVQGQKPLMVIQIDNYLYGYYYKKSNFYWIKWILLVGAYLLVALLIMIILRIQKKLLVQKYQKEQKLTELKLRSNRNQMDPHFIFNAVNAIGAAIFQEDRDTAYLYFTKFSKLLRATMVYSDKLSRFLDEEIDFTKKYLEIEKFRYREKFDYFLNFNEDLDFRNEVPRMVLQTLAESAVNNGLMHRITGGLLTIDIFQNDEIIEIHVTDNGVGIERSKQLNKEKAFKSLKILEEFIVGINELNKKQITLEMFDVFENGQVAGTKVIVRVPYGIRYSASVEITNKPLRGFHL